MKLRRERKRSPQSCKEAWSHGHSEEGREEGPIRPLASTLSSLSNKSLSSASSGYPSIVRLPSSPMVIWTSFPSMNSNSLYRSVETQPFGLKNLANVNPCSAQIQCIVRQRQCQMLHSILMHHLQFIKIIASVQENAQVMLSSFKNQCKCGLRLLERFAPRIVKPSSPASMAS